MGSFCVDSNSIEGRRRRFKRMGWTYLILFSVLYCCLYFGRLNLSCASAALVEQLGWTTSDIGILTSSLFWTYALGQLVNGRIGELAGLNKIILIGALGSVACNVLFGLQSSLWVMAVVWGLNGYFQSMCWSPGVTAIASWWPGNRRGFAAGFATAFSGFGQCGVAFVVAMSFTLFPSMGWKSAFFIPVVFPLIAAVLFAVFAKESPEQCGLSDCAEEPTAISESKSGPFLEPYKLLLGNRAFLAWLLIAFLLGLVRFGLATWVPLYFVQVFGIDVSAGLLESIALPFGMAVGSFAVPALTDRYFSANRLPAVVACSAVAAASVIVFFFTNPTSLAGLLVVEMALFVSGFCIYAIDGLLWAYSIDVGGREHAGTASGMLNCSVYMGAAFQSLFYGVLISRAGWSTLLMSVSVLCVVIACAGTFAARRIKSNV